MSACKTGCGRERVVASLFCDPCADAYYDSPEHAEYVRTGRAAADWQKRGRDSIEAFATRVRAEREGEAPREP